jgi:beta-glucoside PTS system EIICBA component
MKNEQLIVDVLKYIGGKDNIASVAHCMTRLRFTLKDNALVDKQALKSVKGVLGLVDKGEQTQVVIGTHVAGVYRELLEYTGLDGDADTGVSTNTSNKKGNVVANLLETIASIFNPIVPALAGAGLIKAILALLKLAGLSTTGDTYYVINTISDGVFYFLPFLLAVSSAKRFKMSPYVALAIAAAMMHPNFAALIAAKKPMSSFLAIPFKVIEYKSSVLPIVFTIWFASILERNIDRFTPKALKIILVPALTVLITTPIALMTIGPAAQYVGSLLASGVTILFEKGGIFAGIVYGGIYSSMVVLGIHHGMVPVLVQGITSKGFNYISPVSGSSNMAQAGAAFGVWLRTKNKDTKVIAASATISALTGVTEPAVYGVNVKFKKPFLFAAIGGACGGGFAAAFHLKAFAMGGPSFVTWPMFIGEGNSVLLVMAAFAIAFVIAAALTYVFGFEEEQSIVQSNNTIGV